MNLSQDCVPWFRETSDFLGDCEFSVDIKQREKLGASLHERLNKSASTAYCFVGWSEGERQVLADAVRRARATAHTQIAKHPEVLTTLWLKPIDYVPLQARFRQNPRLQYKLAWNVFIFNQRASLRECSQCADAHLRGVYDGTNSKSGNRRLPINISSVYSVDGSPGHRNSALLLLSSDVQYLDVGESVLGFVNCESQFSSTEAYRTVDVPIALLCSSSHVDRNSKQGICVTVSLLTAPAGSSVATAVWSPAGRFAFRVRAVASPYRDMTSELCDLLTEDQFGCPPECQHLQGKTRHQSTKLKRRSLEDEGGHQPAAEDTLPATALVDPPPAVPQPSMGPPQVQSQAMMLYLPQQPHMCTIERLETSDGARVTLFTLSTLSPDMDRSVADILRSVKTFVDTTSAAAGFLRLLGQETVQLPASQASSSSSSGPMRGSQDPVLSASFFDLAAAAACQQEADSSQQHRPGLAKMDTIDLLLRMPSFTGEGGGGSSQMAVEASFGEAVPALGSSGSDQLQQHQASQHQHDSTPILSSMPMLSSQKTILLPGSQPLESTAVADSADTGQPAPRRPRLDSLSTEAAGRQTSVADVSGESAATLPQNAKSVLQHLGLSGYWPRFLAHQITTTGQLRRLSTDELTAPTGLGMSRRDARMLRAAVGGPGNDGSGCGGLLSPLERHTPSTGDSQSGSYRPGGVSMRRSPRRHSSIR